MPRPPRCRKIEYLPLYRSFSPDENPDPKTLSMTVDEFEVIRLLDLEGLNQEACAGKMNISRTTVTAIYDRARKKVADALVHGKRLVITGGFCELPVVVISEPVMQKGMDVMRTAVTYENGEVFQHFGHTPAFKIYDIENGEIKGSQVLDTEGNGHGALAGFLKSAGCDVLICGGIGNGARIALSEAGIQVFGGVSGSADEAASAFAARKLAYDPDAHCDHHEHHEGDCGHDKCHEHGCAGN